MKYDFDEPVMRRGTHCVKWDEEAPTPDIIPMWVADMDFKAAPAIQDALRRRVEHGVFGYSIVPEDYYRSVINWFERRHHWTIEREWIQYTTGVVPALSVIVQAFTKPGDKVILQAPVYNCFFSSIRNNGCEILSSSLLYSNNDERTFTYTMDYDDLEAKAADPRTRLLLLCNPHNPAGRVWTREELQRVADICRKHHVIVVSDEIHNELTYDGRRYVPFGTIDMDNAIICTSASKSFNIAGLQMANIICCHEDWRQKIDRSININEVCDVNPFGPLAAIAAYNESEQWMDELCDYLWQNYQELRTFFAQQMPQLPVAELEGTYLVWVDISTTGLTADELTERLLREGRVQVNSSTMYGCEGFIRINIACPRAMMLEGLSRIAAAISSLASHPSHSSQLS